MLNIQQQPDSTDSSTKTPAAIEETQQPPLEPTKSIAATPKSEFRTTGKGRIDRKAKAGPEVINPSQIPDIVRKVADILKKDRAEMSKDEKGFVLDGLRTLRKYIPDMVKLFSDPAAASQSSVFINPAGPPPAHTEFTAHTVNYNADTIIIQTTPENAESILRHRRGSHQPELPNNVDDTMVLKAPARLDSIDTRQCEDAFPEPGTRQVQAEPPTEPGRNGRPSTCDERVKEYPVPDEVCKAIEGQWTNGANGANNKEFSHMRYTAATCEPDRFTQQDGYSLRETSDGESRLLIGITAYNEGMVFHARTLHAVMENIRDICETKSQDPEKSPSLDWKQIHVAIIIDEPLKDDSDVLKMYTVLGVYQSSAKKKEVRGEHTVAHIFEYTIRVSFDPSSLILERPKADDLNKLVPVRIILIIKARNRQKIDSHKWLFRAIGGMLKPEVCILLDVGTKPGYKSIYYLWEAFKNDVNLGGACGEIVAMTQGWKKLSNFLVAAQNFEYKMSNILDKPFESSFGNVSVLPGAFSAYRYEAIEKEPLDEYFNGDHALLRNIFSRNMFLAEDRILCFALVKQANKKWTSTYVRHSKAETDVPESIAEFIAQRRRWLNGSFAAALYAIFYSVKFLKTDHGKLRKLALFIQALYNFIQILFSWFSLANVWLTFSIIIDFPLNLPDHHMHKSWHTESLYWIGIVLKGVYLVVLGFQFFFALGNRLKGEKLFYRVTVWIYAVFSILLIVLSILNAFEAIKNQVKKKMTIGDVLSSFGWDLIISVLATYVINIVASLLLCDPWHMFSSLIQYMLLTLSFTNALSVYAFCNLHDVSWGTKSFGDGGKGRGNTDAAPKEEESQNEPTENSTQNGANIPNTAFQEAETWINDKRESLLNAKVLREEPTSDDKDRTVRTLVSGAWLMSNIILAISIQNETGLSSGDYKADKESLQKKQRVYFKVILFSTFGLAVFRLFGCIFYFVERVLPRYFRRKVNGKK
ncbi:hypothetical protein ACEPAI_9603 [Sanghuangporus weigelae]